MTSYNIYLKPTNECQLRCQHCYTGDIVYGAMTDEVLRKSVSWICSFVKSHPHDVVSVILHGGECTQYDINKLIDVVSSIDNVRWGITTNLVYKLQRNHIDLFNAMKQQDDQFVIQTSWDYDIRFNSDTQLRLWENNVRFLISSEFVVQPTICVTKSLIESVSSDELLDYLQLLGLDRCNFERLTNTGRASNKQHTPNNHDLNVWLLSAYKHSKKKNLCIPMFESIEQSFNYSYLGCRARKCTETVITINSDGTIATCPNIYHECIGDVFSGIDNLGLIIMDVSSIFNVKTPILSIESNICASAIPSSLAFLRIFPISLKEYPLLVAELTTFTKFSMVV